MSPPRSRAAILRGLLLAQALLWVSVILAPRIHGRMMADARLEDAMKENRIPRPVRERCEHYPEMRRMYDCLDELGECARQGDETP